MKIRVYSTTTCPYCLMAKQYLDDKKVEYENIDVESDPQKAQEMIKISGQMGVPVIVVDDAVVIGFDKERLDQLIK